MNPSASVENSVMSTNSRSSMSMNNAVFAKNSDSAIFQLFDRLSHNAEIPNLFYILANLIITVQAVATAIWPYCSNLVEADEEYGSGLLMLRQIAFFDIGNDLYTFVLHTCAFGVTLIVILILFLYFKLNKRFMNWILYPARIVVSFVIYLWIYPMAHYVGNQIITIGRQGIKDPLPVIFAILDFIYFAVFAFLFNYSHKFIFNSAYLSNNAISNFDPKPLIFTMLYNPIILFFQQLMNLFPKWISIVVIVVQILLFAFVLYFMVYLPFINTVSNVMFFALACTVCLTDVIGIIASLVTGLPTALLPFAILAIFVVSCAGGVLLKILITKNAKKKLAYNGVKNLIDGKDDNLQIPSDDEIMERFMAMKIDRSPRMALFYLQIGLINIGDLFLDTSLMKFVVQHQTNTSILTSCIRIIVLFPSESNMLNMLISSASKSRDLDTGGQFLLYQVYKIKLLRQSSSSVASAASLKEMKQKSSNLLSRCQQFWLKSEGTLASMSELNQEINKCTSRWEETLKDFPNSQNHHEEYSHFLIDVSTRFDQAIKHHHIRTLIEAGKNFSIDYCFRSLISVVPYYLTRQVLDLKGNTIEKKGKRKGSTSHNSTGGFSSSFSSSDIDAKMEEEIGRTIIKQAKMRIAFQNVTENRKTNNMFHLRNDTIINFLVGVIVYSALYFIFRGYFTDRYQATERSMLANTIHFNFVTANMFTLLDWGNQTNNLNLSVIEYVKEKVNYSSIWNESIPFDQEASIYNYASRKAFFEFLVQLSDLSLVGVNVFDLTINVLRENLLIVLCNDGEPLNPSASNLKTALMLTYMSQSLYQLTNNSATWWNTNEELCILMSTAPYIGDGIEAIRNQLMVEEFNNAATVRQIMLYLRIAIPTGVALIMFIPFLTFSILTIKETANFLNMMTRIKSEFKTEAAKTLLKNSEADGEEQEGAINQDSGNYANIIMTYALWFASFALIVGFLVAFLLQCADINDKFEFMSSWSFKHSIRSPISVDILTSFYPAILASPFNPMGIGNPTASPPKPGINNKTGLVERVNELIGKLNRYRNEMVTTDDGTISILGFDNDIDWLLSKETCSPDTTNTTIHSMYECGSIHQQLSFLENWVTSGVGKLDEGYFNNTWTGIIPMHLMHLTFAHLIPQMEQLDDLLSKLMNKFNANYDNMILIYYIVGLLSVAFNLLSSILLMHALDQSYQACLMLLRRVPPVGVVAMNELIDYILHKNIEKENSEMTTTRAVIHNSNDGILCVNIAGTVDTVNPAVTKTLGYTPEQLLGQHFIILVEKEDQEKLQNQLKMMVNRESGLNYSDHIVCVTDNEMNVPCSIDIFGMTDNGTSDGTLNSFVVILRDESEMIAQQEEAEQAKKQSEDLLYQILPRDIVVKLNQGEKDISFVVPSASIMFIDIVKFSEYSAQLTPSEIMGTLSTLFGAFDEALAKYPLLTKIKLIGDVYMSAAGLFNPDDPPVNHAEQMLRFGLDALQIVDDTNIKLTANLNVRIGMNTGGPLIAGVLGTDKPVFDIIGDPINISSRLQSTDIAGRIQISQNVYDLVNSLDFFIEPRGEIFLKGKGKTNAFLVRPSTTAAFQFSNTDISIPNVKSTSSIKA